MPPDTDERTVRDVADLAPNLIHAGASLSDPPPTVRPHLKAIDEATRAELSWITVDIHRSSGSPA